MRVATVLIVILGSGSLLSGCATSATKYNWGGYESSLYTYYKDPTKEPELMGSLLSIINSGAAGKTVVGPGIYAEYGYLLLQQGKLNEAVSSFNEEARRWPESKVFMDRMIGLATQQTSVAITQGAQNNAK
ncbi:MAG: DUF4810 domain-containing protein [Steroidobacteraceae bacterium]